MRGTVSDDSGAQHRVSRIWVSDDTGARHEVVRAWVGDSQGVPRVWFDKDAPLALAVTAAPLDYQSVKLTWVLSPQGEVAQEYRVYRDGVLVQTTALATWTDTGLASGTTYSYRVDAVLKDSPILSGTASATTDTYIPPATVQLFATPANYITVNLSWTVSGQDSFTVKRGSTVLATTGTSYVDTGLTAGGTYTYTITAQKAGAADAVSTRTVITANWPAFSMSASAASYVQNSTSWTNLGAGWTYNLKRAGTSIYSGTNTSFSDTGLAGGTTYSYTVEATWSGAVRRTAAASATTTAWPAFSMSASDGAAWNNIAVSWSNLGGGWSYYLASTAGDIGWVGATSYNHAVGESSNVNYRTDAYWGGALRLQAWDSGSSSARPVSYGTAYSNVGWEGFTGWTGSTARSLGGPDIYVGVGGTFTNMHALVYSHWVSGEAEPRNFRGRPHINGVAGPEQVYKVGRSHTNWPFDLGFGAGTFTTSMLVGGTNWGQAEWSPWTGQRWDYYLQVNHLDYWFYASVERDEEIRAEPWFDEELAGRLLDRGGLYIETWSDEEGTATARAKVTDRDTGEVILEWEREG